MLRSGICFLLCFAAIPLAQADSTSDAAYEVDESVLRTAGINTDTASLLQFIRERTLSDDERRSLAQKIRQLGDESFSRRVQASQDLIKAGRLAIPFLKQALTDPDLEIARRARRCLEAIESGSELSTTLAAIRLLARADSKETAAVLLDYLPFAADEFLVEEIFDALKTVGIRDGKAVPAIVEKSQKGSPLVRAAALFVLGRSSFESDRLLCQSVLKEDNPMIRLRAAQGLLAGNDKSAIPVMIALLKESPLPIAYKAEETLCRLAGEKAPAVSLGKGEPEDRDDCFNAWQNWWKQNSDIDLARLNNDQRTLGLTLVVAFDGYPGGGRVWEVFRNGKVRWQIDNLQGPIDAQMLDNNRVLIAEHNARRLTERDLKGNVLWEYVILNHQYPVAVQRLPNGNTFLATYNWIMELTRDKKIVYQHQCSNAIIYSARKTRDNRIVYVSSNNSLLILNEKGDVLRTVPTANNGWADVALVAGSRFLVTQSREDKVVELDQNGKTVAEYRVANANAVYRLPNGNILVGSHQSRNIVEVNRDGDKVWELKLEGRPFSVRWR
ncbi:MAG: hypothetical protein KatS3mg105_2660 [Gemmatales bacterium]|nr:MAG: hypothetical protein KatS3mg105_2660 [Gemmatales bacterium]